MFKVGAKIDFWPFYVQSRSQNRSVTILNLYMGGGGELTVSPLDRRFDPCLDRCLAPCLERCLAPCLDPCESLCPSIAFFGFRNVFWVCFMSKFLWKSSFPYWIFRYSFVCVGNLAPQQQKSENQKILHSFAPLHIQNLQIFFGFWFFFRKMSGFCEFCHFCSDFDENLSEFHEVF